MLDADGVAKEDVVGQGVVDRGLDVGVEKVAENAYDSDGTEAKCEKPLGKFGKR